MVFIVFLWTEITARTIKIAMTMRKNLVEYCGVIPTAFSGSLSIPRFASVMGDHL